MNKTAIVTGGNRGIGLGIALELARCGWNLIICATGEEQSNRESLDQLRSFGNEVLYVRMNIGDDQSCQAGLDRIFERDQDIHLLVNNAGIGPRQRLDILDTTRESFQEVMKINLEGPFFLTQAIAGRMIQQKKRQDSNDPRMSVINISSISATVASVSRGEYCISKAGVSMATRLWAVRLAEYDIGVYEVRPGIIQSDMTEAVREKYDRLIADGLVPQGRWGFPADVGRAVRVLAEGELTYSTGQVIMVDGGQLLERL